MKEKRLDCENLLELEIITSIEKIRCGYDRCSKELDEGAHPFDMKTARIYCDDPCVSRDDEEKGEGRRFLRYIELKYNKSI